MNGLSPFAWGATGTEFAPLFVGNERDERIYRSSGIVKSQYELLRNTSKTCMRKAGMKREREAAGSADQRKEVE